MSHRRGVVDVISSDSAFPDRYLLVFKAQKRHLALSLSLAEKITASLSFLAEHFHKGFVVEFSFYSVLI